MARNSYGRYHPDQEWMTPQEHRALKDEALVMVILLVVFILATFAEPLMDWLEALL